MNRGRLSGVCDESWKMSRGRNKDASDKLLKPYLLNGSSCKGMGCISHKGKMASPRALAAAPGYDNRN